MASPPRRPSVISDLHTAISRLSEKVNELGPKMRTAVRGDLEAFATTLSELAASLDPVARPDVVFDPANPDAMGRLVALALVVQPKQPLEKVGRAYGSGVYAVYYHGDHPAYALISKSETPIYVGKADPITSKAITAFEQGEKLTGRLRDHRRMIVQAVRYALAHKDKKITPIRIVDFTYRRLVVATNAQLVAEQLLINLFKPVWNKETRVCWGISKHGDSAEMRGHGRSPWDVLHPGRDWALESSGDSRPVGRILDDLRRHFVNTPSFKDRLHVIEQLLGDFIQHPVEVERPSDNESEDTQA